METICDCGHVAVSSGCGTGYGTLDGKTLCYSCIGKEDEKQLLAGNPRGFGFYLADEYTVTNWPGSFKVHCHSQTKKVWHNWSGRFVKRVDIYFSYGGHQYHGVIGNSDWNQSFVPRKIKEKK